MKAHWLLAAAALLALVPAVIDGEPPTPADLVNAYRTERALPALLPSAELDAAAQPWADHLADTSALYHDPDLAADGGWNAMGENVGLGGSVESIQGGFEASPVHEANLVGPYTHLGIGIAVRDSVVWVVQRFGTLAPSTTTTTGTPSTTTTDTTPSTTTPPSPTPAPPTTREATCR